MQVKLEQLCTALKNVEDRIQLDDETRRRVGTTKMGARLKSGNELQEWMERQEYLRNNPEQRGANVFTYKKNTHAHMERGADREHNVNAEEQFFATESLVNEVQLLRLKSQKSLSGVPTRAASQERDVTKWSYFEKLERLKLKVSQTHQRTTLPEDAKKPGSKAFKEFKTVDGITGVNNRQPPNPDWLAAKHSFTEVLAADGQAPFALSFE